MENVENQSWGEMLRDTAANVTEQPDTDSEDEAEQESVDVVEESGEGVDEQPVEDSEPAPLPFNDDTEIEMGDGRQPIKLSELKQGYRRQSDYTKKSQELATQRKEVEALSEKLKPTQDWLNYMDQNPWVWQQIDTALKEFHSTGALPIRDLLMDEQAGPYLNQMNAELNRLRKENESLRGENDGFKLTSDFATLRNDLKGEYGDLVTDEYMSSLQERAKQDKLSLSVLRDIADGHLAKQKLKTQPSTKEVEAKTIQKIAETRKTAPQSPKPSAEVPKTSEQVDTGGTWGDFFRRVTK